MARVRTALETYLPWPPPPRRRDAVLAAVLYVLDVLTFSGLLDGRGGVVVVLYALAGYVPLAWRRQAPVPIFFVLWFHNLAAWIWVPDYRPTLGLLVALFTVAAMQNSRISLAALVATLVTTTMCAVSQELQSPSNGDNPMATIFVTAIFYVLVSLGSWALGRWVRTSQRQMESLEQRRRRAATEAITAERGRIARELHDIVSHSVSVMVLQAAGARRVLASDPKRADDALEHIEAVGKESMVELRRLLGVLRDGALRGESEHGELGPQPGLGDLGALLDEVRHSGLPVRLDVEGKPTGLDPSVDLSAYRIVQEALTNSLKHGGPGTAATIRLVWTADLLVIDILDDGSAKAGDQALSTSHGLLGLRERAWAVGGHLEAGPVIGGGFRVSATLPVAESGRPDPRPATHQAGN